MAQDVNRRAFIGTAAAAAVVAGMTATAQAQQAATDKVKILGIGTSLRKGKTSSAAVQMALDAAKTVDPRIEVELVELSGMNLDPYIAIGGKYVENKADDWQTLKEKLTAAHGIIIASPSYMGIVSSLAKQMMERMIDFRKAGFPLRNKVGGAIAVGAGRNAGVELILQQLCMFMLSQDMVVVGDGKPTAHWGGTLWAKGDDIAQDKDGLPTVVGVGKRVAEVALKLAK